MLIRYRLPRCCLPCNWSCPCPVSVIDGHWWAKACCLSHEAHRVVPSMRTTGTRWCWRAKGNTRVGHDLARCYLCLALIVHESVASYGAEVRIALKVMNVQGDCGDTLAMASMRRNQNPRDFEMTAAEWSHRLLWLPNCSTMRMMRMLAVCPP